MIRVGEGNNPHSGNRFFRTEEALKNKAKELLLVVHGVSENAVKKSGRASKRDRDASHKKKERGRTDK